MNNVNQPIDPQRLCDAAIIVLKACTDYAAAHGGRSVHPTELGSVSDGASREFAPFSRFEIEEATAFLVRMGYLEPVKRPTTG